AASAALGTDQQGRAHRGDRVRQPARPHHPRRADAGPRLAGDRLRAVRPLHQRLLRGSALKLKHHGLREPGVFIVWGPLMIGGTYYVTAGTMPAWVWLATLPYAITVTTVLIGKHIDKFEQDSARGIHTLPVILGKETSLRLNQTLMIAFYPIVA